MRNKQKNRYLLFGTNGYESQGGMGDILSYDGDMDELVDRLKKYTNKHVSRRYKDYHIYDTVGDLYWEVSIKMVDGPDDLDIRYIVECEANGTISELCRNNIDE